jgi:Terpene cyclase DEP1
MIRYVYLVLCAVGTVLPGWQLVGFLREHGLNVGLMVEQLFASRVSGFFGWDVIVSSVVLWVFVLMEGRRRGMKNLWVYFVCSLTVGVSLALPLFLYVRERGLARGEAVGSAGA